jgi:hypothetical protein
MCPMTPDPPPDEGGLRCHHVSHGSRPASQCRSALVSWCVSWHQAHLPVGEGSGVTMCPVTSGSPPSEGGLQCHHVSCGSRPASQCGRALASWHVPWHRASLPTRECSGVTMCPTVLDPPAGAEGLWRRHVPHDSRHAMGHKQMGNTQPVYLLGWAHLPPRHARAFPRHMALGSS